MRVRFRIKKGIRDSGPNSKTSLKYIGPGTVTRFGTLRTLHEELRLQGCGNLSPENPYDVDPIRIM